MKWYLLARKYFCQCLNDKQSCLVIVFIYHMLHCHFDVKASQIKHSRYLQSKCFLCCDEIIIMRCFAAILCIHCSSNLMIHFAHLQRRLKCETHDKVYHILRKSFAFKAWGFGCNIHENNGVIRQLSWWIRMPPGSGWYTRVYIPTRFRRLKHYAAARLLYLCFSWKSFKLKPNASPLYGIPSPLFTCMCRHSFWLFSCILLPLQTF